MPTLVDEPVPSDSEGIVSRGAVQIQDKSFKFLWPQLKLIMQESQWCREPELNRRHEDFQSSALPPELSRHTKLKNHRQILQSRKPYVNEKHTVKICLS